MVEYLLRCQNAFLLLDFLLVDGFSSCGRISLLLSNIFPVVEYLSCCRMQSLVNALFPRLHFSLLPTLCCVIYSFMERRFMFRYFGFYELFILYSWLSALLLP
jgi:hypothetical protein